MHELVTDPAYKNMPDQGEMSLHMPLLENMAKYCTCVIELGCGHGNGSTRAIARGMAASDKHPGELIFVSVDNNPAKPEVQPAVPFWTIVYGDTQLLTTVKMVELTISRRIPDLIFIDTEHTKEHLAKELAVWSKLAGPQTVWLLHDTWMSDMYNPMVEAAIEFCAANPPWQYDEITKLSHGMGRIRQL